MAVDYSADLARVERLYNGYIANAESAVAQLDASFSQILNSITADVTIGGEDVTPPSTTLIFPETVRMNAGGTIIDQTIPASGTSSITQVNIPTVTITRPTDVNTDDVSTPTITLSTPTGTDYTPLISLGRDLSQDISDINLQSDDSKYMSDYLQMLMDEVEEVLSTETQFASKATQDALMERYRERQAQVFRDTENVIIARASRAFPLPTGMVFGAQAEHALREQVAEADRLREVTVLISERITENVRAAISQGISIEELRAGSMKILLDITRSRGETAIAQFRAENEGIALGIDTDLRVFDQLLKSETEDLDAQIEIANQELRKIGVEIDVAKLEVAVDTAQVDADVSLSGQRIQKAAVELDEQKLLSDTEVAGARVYISQFDQKIAQDGLKLDETKLRAQIAKDDVATKFERSSQQIEVARLTLEESIASARKESDERTRAIELQFKNFEFISQFYGDLSGAVSGSASSLGVDLQTTSSGT